MECELINGWLLGFRRFFMLWGGVVCRRFALFAFPLLRFALLLFALLRFALCASGFSVFVVIRAVYHKLFAANILRASMWCGAVRCSSVLCSAGVGGA